MPQWLLDLLTTSPLAAVFAFIWWKTNAERLADKDDNKARQLEDYQFKLSMIPLLENIRDEFRAMRNTNWNR